MLTEFGIEGNVKRFTLLCLLDSGLPFESDWSVRSEQSGMEGIPLSWISTRRINVEAEKFPAISLVIHLAAGTCLFYQSILLPQNYQNWHKISWVYLQVKKLGQSPPHFSYRPKLVPPLRDS